MAIDWKIHTYAQLSSTQDYVRELVEEDFPEGIVVQCLTQTKGRGRQGREWHSPMGNLYLSVLLRPDCTAEQGGQLSFVVAVAVSAAIDEVLAEDHDKKLKWPNDILINEKKCAGILLESEMDSKGKVKALIVGMGINIHAPPADEGIGLQSVTHEITIPVHKLRDRVLHHLSEQYERWKKDGFEPIRKDWLGQAYRLGKEIKIRQGDDRYITGTLKNISIIGELMLEIDGKIEKYSTGEVFS